MRNSAEDDRRSQGDEPAGKPEEPGVGEGSQTPKEPKLPFMPDENDDSDVGDTDQHSTA